MDDARSTLLPGEVIPDGLELRRIPSKGRGLFTTVPLKSGAIVMRTTGLLFDDAFGPVQMFEWMLAPRVARARAEAAAPPTQSVVAAGGSAAGDVGAARPEADLFADVMLRRWLNMCPEAPSVAELSKFDDSRSQLAGLAARLPGFATTMAATTTKTVSDCSRCSSPSWAATL
jgi:hypothetical protein